MGKSSSWHFEKSMICTSTAKMKRHDDYQAAKSGDLKSAIRLVADLIDINKLSTIKSKYPDAIIVSVHEYGISNALPQALAHIIGEHLGMDVDTQIVKSNKTHHTGNNACHRFISRSTFDGHVKKDHEYIIIDDHITQGGTISDLKYYLQANGGKVVGAMTLTASLGSFILAPQQRTLEKLYRKVSPEDLSQLFTEYNIYGGDISAITNSEAGWLGQFRNIDSIRNKFIEGQQEGTSKNSHRACKRTTQDKGISM